MIALFHTENLDIFSEVVCEYKDISVPAKLSICQVYLKDPFVVLLSPMRALKETSVTLLFSHTVFCKR